MSGFWNAVRAHAAQVASLQAGLRWGTVSSVDPQLYRVKVTLQPEDVTTAWLPILSHGAGAGWSMLMIPTVGAQAAVMADSTDASNGVVVGFAHSTVDTPPSIPNAIGTGGTPNSTAAPNVAGELVIRNEAGAALRLCADGSIYLLGPVNIDGTVRVNGNITATGGITAGFGGADSVTLQFHTHMQPPDAHGDAEQSTNSPTAGT